MCSTNVFDTLTCLVLFQNRYNLTFCEFWSFHNLSVFQFTIFYIFKPTDLRGSLQMHFTKESFDLKYTIYYALHSLIRLISGLKRIH